jgi:NAD(P)-dependent dehydrogenase (short-subunit alcohol dehydrogenase family)
VKSLEGKVALITGGGQGIGMGIARAMAEAGAGVVITGRNEDKLIAAAEKIRKWGGGEVLTVTGDVRNRRDTDHAVAVTVEKFGRVDILVNNAQIMMQAGQLIEDTADEDMMATLQSGLLGTLYFMQGVFPHMQENGGSIINFASRHGVVGDAGMGIYAMTKEAIRGLSRVAAREWGPHNIRVNVISPVATSAASLEFVRQDPEKAKHYLSQMALGRPGNAYRDIAPVAVFLGGNESRYLTGQILNADGGQVML